MDVLARCSQKTQRCRLLWIRQLQQSPCRSHHHVQKQLCCNAPMECGKAVTRSWEGTRALHWVRGSHRHSRILKVSEQHPSQTQRPAKHIPEETWAKIVMTHLCDSLLLLQYSLEDWKMKLNSFTESERYVLRGKD